MWSEQSVKWGEWSKKDRKNCQKIIEKWSKNCRKMVKKNSKNDLKIGKNNIYGKLSKMFAKMSKNCRKWSDLKKMVTKWTETIRK